jgi:hypothetical protein
MEKQEKWNVANMVLTVAALLLSVATAVFAFGGYQQSAVNTTGINAQIRAQRALLQASLSAPVVPGAAALTGSRAGEAGVRRALSALQQYKLPKEQ